MVFELLHRLWMNADINGIINVINGKNGVSRYIPVADSLKKVLHGYAETIDMTDKNKPFFNSSYTGGHLTYSAMRYMFPKMFKAADIYTISGKTPNITCCHTQRWPERRRKPSVRCY